MTHIPLPPPGSSLAGLTLRPPSGPNSQTAIVGYHSYDTDPGVHEQLTLTWQGTHYAITNSVDLSFTRGKSTW